MKDMMEIKKPNAGFWMDADKLTKDTDVITLNTYRRSIANFVRIVTGKQIPVTFNTEDHSYTDGKQVVISGQIENDQFDSAVGLACHEASHILLSNFEMLKKLMGKGSVPFDAGLIDEQLVKDVMTKYNVSREYAENYVKMTIKNLLNWVEDRRIDHHIFSTSPGYKGYYHAMYDRYFHSENIDKGIASDEFRTETLSDYMFRIINLTNSNRELDALKGLQDIWDIVDLGNIKRLTTSEDALAVAFEIFEVIEKNVEGFDSKAEEDQEDQEDQDGQGGEGDDDCDCEGEGQDGQSKSPGGNGQPDPHKDFKGDKSKDEPQEGEEDDADDSGEGAESGEEGEGEEGEGDDSNDPGKEQGGSDGKAGDGKPLTDAEVDAIKKDIEMQRDFLNGNVDKASITDRKAQELQAVAEANSSLENVGKTYSGGKESIRKHGINCVVYRNMTRSFIESGACPFTARNYYGSGQKGYEQAVIEGLQKGIILGKKMAVRQESRQTYYNRQKKGGLDSRLVAEAGFGNVKIFGHKEVEQFAPAYVHISIDASGSMSGQKFYQAQVSSVAIAKAATMVQGLDCVISYRGCTDGKPAIMIAYDSRVDNISKVRALFGAICPTGSTPEGLCFEAVMNEIVMGNSKQHSYFVNMSDGEPGFSGYADNAEKDYVSYSGEAAVNHTREMVNKLRQRGVQVLSYFIGGGSNGNSAFKSMYGKDAAYVDVNNVMQIAKTMNKLFMKKSK